MEEGITLDARTHFIDKDHYEWVLVAKSQDGNVLAEVRGNVARRTE